MAFLRKRAGGSYSLPFRRQGNSHTKALGTDDEQAAKQIKRDAEDQLIRTAHPFRVALAALPSAARCQGCDPCCFRRKSAEAAKP